MMNDDIGSWIKDGLYIIPTSKSDYGRIFIIEGNE